MNAEHKPGLRFNAALCLLAMTALAAAVLLWVGLSPFTAVPAAIVIGCLAACGSAWFLARRALRPLEPAPATRGAVMNWQAPFYDLGCRLVGLGPRFRRWTLNHAALRAGERVLDVGCGTGVLTRLAAESVGGAGEGASGTSMSRAPRLAPVGEAIGIDPGAAMIAVARRRSAASRARFRLAAIEQLPFEDRRFDAVLSSLMLHHLPPDLKTQGLAEVWRVLRPGGRLVVVDLDRPANPLGWLLFWPWLAVPMIADHLRGRIPEYLRAAGFAPVESRGHWLGVLTLWVARKPGAE
jgi:ubiquinone/menaquinone biosynthesis C-methylase UbiE